MTKLLLDLREKLVVAMGIASDAMLHAIFRGCRRLGRTIDALAVLIYQTKLVDMTQPQLKEFFELKTEIDDVKWDTADVAPTAEFDSRSTVATQAIVRSSLDLNIA